MHSSVRRARTTSRAMKETAPSAASRGTIGYLGIRATTRSTAATVTTRQGVDDWRPRKRCFRKSGRIGRFHQRGTGEDSSTGDQGLNELLKVELISSS